MRMVGNPQLEVEEFISLPFEAKKRNFTKLNTAENLRKLYLSQD